MMEGNVLTKLYSTKVRQFQNWSQERISALFLFNMVLGLLLLLHSAGYFAPFFLLTINFIAVISLVLAVILFRINSSIIFFITILFWIFAALLKITNVEAWAVRSAIYAFESLVIGVLLMIIEAVIRNQQNEN